MDKPPGASDACRECRFLPVAGSRLSGGRQRCRRGRGLRAAFPQQVASAISEHLLRRSHGRGVGGRPRGHLRRKAGQGPARPLATPSHCLEGSLGTGVFTFATWPCPGSRGGTLRVATGAANPAPAWPPWTEGLGPPVSQEALVQVTRGLLAASAETGLPVLGVPENACISLLFV